jgi:hypothetical protein
MEGSEEGAGSLQGDDVVLLTPWSGWRGSAPAGRWKAEWWWRNKLIEAAGNGAGMPETEIGGVKEHQRTTAELWLHWIRIWG